ncbi:MAG: PmbA/TldA family metallopeptidase, partial [Gemmatimonadales bacterium]
MRQGRSVPAAGDRGRASRTDRGGPDRGRLVIADLLDRARRRAQAADALWRSAETTSVSFESGRLKAAGVSHQAGVGLRLVVGG